MKKIFLTVLAITALILTSCKNTVDIYSNSGDSTIVYAMLDPGLDTNYFKITKSFVGNANQYAQNYDANNYGYDEIDVKLIGKFENMAGTQTLTLDTISKFLPYDTTSIFYNGCRQTYYYTAKRLKDGESYRLEIFRKADSVTISTEVTTLSKFYYKTQKMQGIHPNFNMLKDNGLIAWYYTNKVSKATYFDISIYFSYIENPGAFQTKQTIVWNVGSGAAENLYNSNEDIYNIRFKPSSFFSILENDEHLKNTQASSRRIIDTIKIKVSGIGEDLYNYYLVNNSPSAIQDVPNYSNIENGVGLVSARSSSLLPSKISKESLDKIVDDFPQYNFYYLP